MNQTNGAIIKLEALQNRSPERGIVLVVELDSDELDVGRHRQKVGRLARPVAVSVFPPPIGTGSEQRARVVATLGEIGEPVGEATVDHAHAHAAPSDPAAMNLIRSQE